VVPKDFKRWGMPGALIIVLTSPFCWINWYSAILDKANQGTHLSVLPDLILQGAGSSMLGHLLQALTSSSSIGPVAIAMGMGGSNYLTQTCAPRFSGKVFGMSVPGPLALQNDLDRKSIPVKIRKTI